MEITKRDQTKELLAACFKELMLKMPFSRITIRTITDAAGLIRPTFYKHFQDKYEVLEWIFDTEVAAGTDLLLEGGMELDAILMLFRSLEKDKAFYKKAYTIEGANSFREKITGYLYSTCLRLARRHPLYTKGELPALTYEVIARYHTSSLANLIEDWICGRIDCTADELYKAYLYLLENSAMDLAKKAGR